jgi:intracellular septation protein A
MAERIRALLRFAYDNFLPLIIFVGAKAAFGLKAAIGAAIAISVVDLSVRLVRRTKISRLYLFTFAVTAVFGAIDLYAATPFVFAYEPAFTNLLTAGFFGITLFRGTPLIEELAVKTMPAEEAARSDVRAYLRVLTWVWTGYFVAKAALYGYVGYAYDIDRGIAVRSIVGPVSLVALLFGERVVRKPFFALLQRLGVLPPAPVASPST